jgi:hypothetical protein
LFLVAIKINAQFINAQFINAQFINAQFINAQFINALFRQHRGIMSTERREKRKDE